MSGQSGYTGSGSGVVGMKNQIGTFAIKGTGGWATYTNGQKVTNLNDLSSVTGCNIGNCYDTSSQTYTCPIQAMYYFTIRVYTFWGNQGLRLYLNRNGGGDLTPLGDGFITSYIATGTSDTTVHQAALIRCDAGDTVILQSEGTSDVHGDNSRWEGWIHTPLAGTFLG